MVFSVLQPLCTIAHDFAVFWASKIKSILGAHCRGNDCSVFFFPWF